MKKSLIFSFVFFATILLSLSLISAGLWITGDVGQKAGTTTVRETSISKTSDTNTVFSRADASTSNARTSSGTSSVKENQNLVCPRGKVWIPTTDVNGKDCCMRKAENKGREGSTRFPWGYKVDK